MLQNRVRAIPGLDGTPHATCLYATIYWVYEDLHGVGPTEKVMGDIGHHCTFTKIFSEFMKAGKKLSRPAAGAVVLTPGSVLIFEKNGQPGHGCVAISAAQIGGYNQTNWFSTEGRRHAYSTHAAGDVVWRGAQHPNQVQVNVQGQWGALYQVDQSKAKDILFKHESKMPRT